MIDVPGFEIIDGSESQDGSQFHGEWLIRFGDVSGRIILDCDTSAVTVAHGRGLLGVSD